MITGCANSDLETQVDDLEERVAILEAEAATNLTTRTLNGNIFATEYRNPGERCVGELDNYALMEGSRVEVRNGAGELIGISEITSETFFETNLGETVCILPFSLELPTDENIYEIKAEGATWQFNRADLDDANWDLNLGYS